MAQVIDKIGNVLYEVNGLKTKIFEQYSDFTNANLDRLNYPGLGVKRSNEVGLNFTNASLKKSVFVKIDLSKTNFTGADLSHASFFSCNFTGANFTNANLSHAYLQRSILKNADFTGVEVFGTSFHENKDLDEVINLEAFKNSCEFRLLHNFTKSNFYISISGNKKTIEQWDNIFTKNKRFMFDRLFWFSITDLEIEKMKHAYYHYKECLIKKAII